MMQIGIAKLPKDLVNFFIMLAEKLSDQRLLPRDDFECIEVICPLLPSMRA